MLAAKDLFMGAGDGMNLDVYLPRTLKEFETYASNIVSRYVTIHQKDKNFKAFIKSLVKVRAGAGGGRLCDARSSREWELLRAGRC